MQVENINVFKICNTIIINIHNMHLICIHFTTPKITLIFNNACTDFDHLATYMQ